MANLLKNLRPKANSLVDLPSYIHMEDVVKNQILGNALATLMEESSFPPPVQKFFKIPKFKELVERLKEGTLEGAKLESKEIHALQLLLESFHKLVHLDYDFEEIEHPVVEAKVLEQNIQDYLACIDLFFPYENKITHEILSDLFQSVHFFIDRLKKCVLQNTSFFSDKLIAFMESEVVALLINLDRANYEKFQMEKWYPVAIELNIDAKLELKKRELLVLSKGNGHKILNQLQTILSDISRVYLRNPPHEVAESVKTIIISKLSEMPPEEKLSGQKINELFYLEFWKEFYAVLLTQEKGSLTKLQALNNQLIPLKMSLHSLIQQYNFILPKFFSTYIKEHLQETESMLSNLGKPDLLQAQFTIGFYNTQYEYLNETLSCPDHTTPPLSVIEKIETMLPSVFSFLEIYRSAKPLSSFHVLKEYFENFFSGNEALEAYSPLELKHLLDQRFAPFIPTNPSPLPLLQAAHAKIMADLKSILKEVTLETIEYRILQEKISSFERIDLPSYAQTWHTIGEIISVLFMCKKNLFSSPFFQNFFGQ